ncbi:MAG: hypothetical protein LBV70_03260, partial [Candidatus Adiutrix sp.]|nr:hypothetical protein [Candidatus Adiutrix sp.]
MKEDAAAKGPKPLGGRILPIVVFFCLLLGLGAVLFALWKRETQNSPPPPAAANEEIESLRRQKAELEERLRDEPCVLRRSLGQPQGPAAADQAAPGGPAAVAPSPGPQESKYESVDRIEDATVFIISAAGGDVSIGTGFFVAPDMVLSNAHVVGDAAARVLVINRKLAAPVEAS